MYVGPTIANLLFVEDIFVFIDLYIAFKLLLHICL